MKRSKLITMGISLLAAICLWAYVVTVVNPDGDTIISGIPVTFSGQEVLREDQGLVIKGDYNDMVTVHFYGKNSDLKKLEQYKDEITAVVDVSKVRSAKEYQLTYQLTLPNAVQASAVQDTDRNPSVVTIQVEKLLRREIEVRGDFSGVEIAEGYLLGSRRRFDYDTVTVGGRGVRRVDQLECAQIVDEPHERRQDHIAEQRRLHARRRGRRARSTPASSTIGCAMPSTLTLDGRRCIRRFQLHGQLHRRRRRDGADATCRT